MSKNVCRRCGHYWHSRIDDPSRCPECGIKDWHKDEVIILRCGCSYEWKPNGQDDITKCGECGRWENLPDYCPDCRTYNNYTVKKKRWKKDDSVQ